MYGELGQHSRGLLWPIAISRLSLTQGILGPLLTSRRPSNQWLNSSLVGEPSPRSQDIRVNIHRSPSKSKLHQSRFIANGPAFSSRSCQYSLQLPRVLNRSFSWGMQLPPIFAALVAFHCTSIVELVAPLRHFCGVYVVYTERPATIREQFLGHHQLSVIRFISEAEAICLQNSDYYERK
jgi:hypothetical protein